MAESASHEGDSSIIVSLSEAAMHMYTAAIDALPFVEDKKFHKRADVVLSGMRKLRAALTDAASSGRPSPGVIVELSNVRRRYDTLMAHVATAPGTSLGIQLYVTRIEAKLSAQEVANGMGLSGELLDAFEASAEPNPEEAAKIRDAIAALGGVPGIEHHEHHESEPEPEEEHVNGWDESLVGEHAG